MKKGVIEGDSARQVRQLLRDKGMMPLNIQTAANQDKNTKTNLSVNLAAASVQQIWRYSPDNLQLWYAQHCHSTKHFLQLASKLKNRASKV